MKTCKAWISVYGDEEIQKSTLEGLKSAEGYIRRELARRVNLRNTPEIRFIVDHLHHDIRLNDIKLLHLVKAIEHKTAFKPCFDLFIR